METQTISVLLAEGFEEIEAVTIIDVLRRAGLEVLATSISATPLVTGAHGLEIRADTLLNDLSVLEIDMIVMPGGMPGAENLAANQEVLALLRDLAERNAWIGAICAAPIALAAAGLTKGRRLTCYPGFETRLLEGTCTGKRVEVDRRIITGQGPGSALEFSLELVRHLAGSEMADKLQSGMLA